MGLLDQSLSLHRRICHMWLSTKLNRLHHRPSNRWAWIRRHVYWWCLARHPVDAARKTCHDPRTCWIGFWYRFSYGTPDWRRFYDELRDLEMVLLLESVRYGKDFFSGVPTNNSKAHCRSYLGFDYVRAEEYSSAA